MTTTVEQIEADALSLSKGERARLAERLIASLDADAEVEEAWAKEIERRVQALDNGTVKGIPAVEVFSEIRNRLR